MSIPASPRTVVTGGSSGLGRELCLALAARRAKIVIADLDGAGAEQTARAVREVGGEAWVQPCDVAKIEQVETLAAFSDAKLGGIDLLVNNAGVVAGGAVGSLALADWAWVMGVNLWGVIHGCHVFAPRLRAQRAGHILNIASAAGLVASPDTGPYNVSKAGVVSLSETLVAELLPFTVGVTVVCPTFFHTNIVKNGRFRGDEAEAKGRSAQKLMEASTVSAREIAQRALRSCDRDQLYCVPMADALWGWRLKRLLPEWFSKWCVPRVVRGYMEEANRPSKADR